MKNPIRILLVISLVVVGIMATSGAVSAAPPEKEDGFVCPVLGGKAGMNGMHKGLTFIDNSAYAGVDDFYTVVGPNVSVPRHATNGNNGTNNPHGPYASPGDKDYTAIWP